MSKFYFEKLVRDKVVDDCLKDPKVTETNYRVLEGSEYVQELIRKVHEEADEIPIDEQIGSQEALSELADLQNVVDALRKTLGFSEDQVKEAGARKTTKKGGFRNRQYIEYVILADDSEWVDIFRGQPDKYREEEV